MVAHKASRGRGSWSEANGKAATTEVSGKGSLCIRQGRGIGGRYGGYRGEKTNTQSTLRSNVDVEGIKIHSKLLNRVDWKINDSITGHVQTKIHKIRPS